MVACSGVDTSFGVPVSVIKLILVVDQESVGPFVEGKGSGKVDGRESSAWVARYAGRFIEQGPGSGVANKRVVGTGLVIESNGVATTSGIAIDVEGCDFDR